MAIVSAQLMSFPVKQLSWVTQDDLIVATEDNQLIAAIVKTQYGSLNIDKVFTELMQCGKLLQVALTAAGRNDCSLPILKALSGYQTLCNTSVVTTGCFVTSCIAALKAHKLIVMAFEKGKPDLGIKQYEKCAKVAADMAALAQRLEDQADALVKDTEDGLYASQKDAGTAEDKKKAVRDKMREAEAKRAQHAAALQSLEEEKRKAEEDEERAAKAAREADAQEREDAKEARKQQQEAIKEGNKLAAEQRDKDREHAKPVDNGWFRAKIVNASLPAFVPDKALAEVMPVTRTSLEHRKKEETAMIERRRIMAMQRDQNADLAGQLSTLSNLRVEENSLELSIELLTTCVKTLGKVVTTFKNVKLFWEAVAEHCKSLVSMQDTVKDMWEINEEFAGEVEEAVFQSAVSWAALGRVNLDANRAMVASKQITDNIMCSLPDGEASKKEVENLVKALTISLDQSNEEMLMIEAACEGC